MFDQLLFKLLSSRLLCNHGALLCVFMYTALRQSLWQDHSVISLKTYSTNQKPVSGFPNFFGPIKRQSEGFPNFVHQSKFQGPTKMSPLLCLQLAEMLSKLNFFKLAPEYFFCLLKLLKLLEDYLMK